MRLKVPCPSCGKNVRYDERDAAQQALCRACGARVHLPSAPLLAPLDSVSREAGGPSAGGPATGDGPIPLSTLSQLQDPAGAATARPGHDDPTVDEWPRGEGT